MNWQPIESVPKDGSWVRIRAKWTKPEGELLRWSVDQEFQMTNGATIKTNGFWEAPCHSMWVHEPDPEMAWRPEPPPVSSQDGEGG